MFTLRIHGFDGFLAHLKLLPLWLFSCWVLVFIVSFHTFYSSLSKHYIWRGEKMNVSLWSLGLLPLPFLPKRSPHPAILKGLAALLSVLYSTVGGAETV